MQTRIIYSKELGTHHHGKRSRHLKLQWVCPDHPDAPLHENPISYFIHCIFHPGETHSSIKRYECSVCHRELAAPQSRGDHHE